MRCPPSNSSRCLRFRKGDDRRRPSNFLSLAQSGASGHYIVITNPVNRLKGLGNCWLVLVENALYSQTPSLNSEPFTSVAIVWDERTNRVPERVRVFLVPEMGEFVGHNVILYLPRSEYETPV